jgi:ribulose-phosphate 3-epimerase
VSGVRIAASILSADFARLGDEIRAAEAAGVDWIHLDVMDGHFVPNLTFGANVVAAVRRVTELPLDVHLMIEKPERYLEQFAEAGAQSLTVHAEASPHLHRTLQRIRDLGVQAGVAINPATPLCSIREVAPALDLLLIMSVNPGFGGQAFIPGSEEKVRRARDLLTEHASASVDLQVDGGVDPQRAPELVRAGATVLVAGSAIFQSGKVGENVAALRAAVAPAAYGSRPQISLD